MGIRARRLAAILTSALVIGQVLPATTFSALKPLTAWAEEEENPDEGSDESTDEEEEYIPESYYESIQTNDIPGWPQASAIQADAAIVVDMDTGTVLFSKNADRREYPASITKIMTTLVALDSGVELDKKFKVGEEVYAIEADSSNLGIKPGEKLTMRQALYGLMLESANDLANAIAVKVGGSVEAFADMMNAKAAELGCTDTHFVTPSGLHNAEHYVTAQDMAKIAMAAYNNEMFREIISTTQSSIPVTNITDEERYFANHHKMIQQESDYYQSWCTGGKTGYTSDAWNTLVTFGEKDGRRLVCVILRENGAQRSYEETTQIMNYGFDNFGQANLTEGFKAKTFAQIMGLEDPKLKGSDAYVAPELQQTAVTLTNDGVVTVPAGTDVNSITTKYENGMLNYYIGGWKVGDASFAFTPYPTNLTFTFKQQRDVTALMEQNKSQIRKKKFKETAQKAAQNLEGFISDTVVVCTDYVANNQMTVIAVGAFVLVVLIILLVVIIMRCTRDYRIHKKRLAEEKQLQREAEEIEKMSAIEIEAELRAAMAEEEKKKKRAQERELEAQKAEDELAQYEKIIDAKGGKDI